MLTEKEKDRIRAVNKVNEWGLYKKQLKQLIGAHKEARAEGDKHTMEAIEFRLTDINFHYECGLLMQGEYKEAFESLNEW